MHFDQDYPGGHGLPVGGERGDGYGHSLFYYGHGFAQGYGSGLSHRDGVGSSSVYGGSHLDQTGHPNGEYGFHNFDGSGFGMEGRA